MAATGGRGMSTSPAGRAGHRCCRSRPMIDKPRSSTPSRRPKPVTRPAAIAGCSRPSERRTWCTRGGCTSAGRTCWRFGRDLPQAAAVIEEWIAAMPEDPLVTTCVGRWPFSAGTTRPPRRRSPRRSTGTGPGSAPPACKDFSGAESLPTRYYLARAQLKLALSQARVGDRDQALATYQEVIELTDELAVAALQGAADDHLIQTRYHALAQRGDLFLADQRYDDAVRSYDEAISPVQRRGRVTPRWGGDADRRGRRATGRWLCCGPAGPADSVASARQALARDADNPIFIEAYASALRESERHRGGHFGVPEARRRSIRRCSPRRTTSGCCWPGVRPAPGGRAGVSAKHRRQPGLRPGMGQPRRGAQCPAPAVGLSGSPGRVAAGRQPATGPARYAAGSDAGRGGLRQQPRPLPAAAAGLAVHLVEPAAGNRVRGADDSSV